MSAARGDITCVVLYCHHTYALALTHALCHDAHERLYCNGSNKGYGEHYHGERYVDMSFSYHKDKYVPL